jgi:hypothetical protein
MRANAEYGIAESALQKQDKFYNKMNFVRVGTGSHTSDQRYKKRDST